MNNEIRLIFNHEEMKRLQKAYRLNTGEKNTKLDNVFIKLSNNKALLSMTTGYQGLTIDITKNVYNYDEIDESLINREFTFSLPNTKTKKKNDRVNIIITDENIVANCLIDNSMIDETLKVDDFQFFDNLNKLYEYDEVEYCHTNVDIDKMIEVLQGLKARKNQIVKISMNTKSEVSPLQFYTKDNDKALLLPIRMAD